MQKHAVKNSEFVQRYLGLPTIRQNRSQSGACMLLQNLALLCPFLFSSENDNFLSPSVLWMKVAFSTPSRIPRIATFSLRSIAATAAFKTSAFLGSGRLTLVSNRFQLIGLSSLVREGRAQPLHFVQKSSELEGHRSESVRLQCQHNSRSSLSTA